MKKVTIFSSLLLLAAVGCQTPYGPNLKAGGYEEMQIEEGTYQVSFYGNANTSYEKVNDFALMRAAELGLTMGYTYFTVVGEENRTETSSYQSPVIHHDNHHNEHDYGFRSHSYEGISISIGGRPVGHHQTHYQTTTSSEPGVMILVKYFEEYPTGEHLPNPILDCEITFERIQLAYELQAP